MRPSPMAAPAGSATPACSARRVLPRLASPTPFHPRGDCASVSGWRAALDALPRERTWLLPALHAVQHDLHWIPSHALAAVAAHLRVPASEVYGVATHYPEVRVSEPEKRVVRVCTGVSCRISGGLGCLAALERQLRVRAPATAADGSVTLEPLDCAFNCSVAPVV